MRSARCAPGGQLARLCCTRRRFRAERRRGSPDGARQWPRVRRSCRYGYKRSQRRQAEAVAGERGKQANTESKVAATKALKEEQPRAAQLEKTKQDLEKALTLKSIIRWLTRRRRPRRHQGAACQPPAPAVAAKVEPPKAVAVAPAAPPKPEPAKVELPKPAPAPAPVPGSCAAAPPPAPAGASRATAPPPPPTPVAPPAPAPVAALTSAPEPAPATAPARQSPRRRHWWRRRSPRLHRRHRRPAG